MTDPTAYFDCDNHYYEPVDAFTRHLDPRLGARCVEWCTVNGRQFYSVGGKIFRAVANPTFDPVAAPGALHQFFRGNPDAKLPEEYLREHAPIRAEYQDRDARVAVLDEQGLAAAWVFPTMGMLFEEQLKHDPFAVTTTFSAFNRWLLDDWGFARDERLVAAPYLSLADVEWACAELDWALDQGARNIVMRPAAPTTSQGQRSPFDPMFDPFWARLNEAGVPVVIHAADSGYSTNGYADGSFSAQFGGVRKPTLRTFSIERAAADFVITSVFERLFDRFPNLRMASIENGSDYLPDTLAKLTSVAQKSPGWFREPPVDTLRRHWWINPFWEDDVEELVDLMGSDRVIFGSDWPHIEGMPTPLDYLASVDGLAPADERRVMFSNTHDLNTPHPCAG